MRTIVEFTASSEAGDIQARLKRSLTEYGWTMPEIGIERQKIVGMVTDIFRSVKKSGRDLPVSTSSAEIQTVIDAYVKASPHSTDGSEPEGSPGAKIGRAELFTHYSFERTCLEQALLILTQIDPNEHAESFAREFQVVAGPEFGVYGIVFWPHESSDHFIARLRSNDLEKLQSATASFVSALNPGKTDGRTIQRVSSRSASVGRSVPARSQRFRSAIVRLEIRSVANEPLFKGIVVPITGRMTLLRESVADRSGMILASISVSLIVFSAALFWIFPTQPWGIWTQQLVGRLATGAFGALLVDGAIDYGALRKSLMAGTGPVTHGALVRWSRQ